MNKVNQLFLESGRPNQGDNRNFFVKALDKVLTDGFISIKIQQDGKIWTNPKHVDSNGNLIKFNIEITGYGWRRRVYKNSFSAKDLLEEVGSFIQNPSISDKHVKSISVSGLEVCECERCNGKGIISQFNYYCAGICFECYGSKYSVKKVTITA
jgi:hypothetical protein